MRPAFCRGGYHLRHRQFEEARQLLEIGPPTARRERHWRFLPFTILNLVHVDIESGEFAAGLDRALQAVGEVKLGG